MTKQVLRLSLARLIHLSTELGRSRGGRPVPVRRGGPGSALVPIRVPGGGEQPPIFLMHPVGGSVIAYYQLARALGPDQPVYAIENQVAFNPEAHLHRTIEDMAAAYVEMIATVQREGPYLIGGYSMGGLLAFEMARQLAALGRSVPLVGIIDTPAQVAGMPADQEDEGLTAREVLTMATIIGRRLDMHLGLRAVELELLGPDERVARLIEALRTHGIVPPEGDTALFRQLVAAIKSNDAAQRRYRPQSYLGEVDLLRTTQASKAISAEIGTLFDDPSLGWQDVCTQQVTVERVTGTHLRLMDQPHVQKVGAWLQRAIDHRLAVAESR